MNKDTQNEVCTSGREKYWEEKGIKDRVERNNIEQLYRRINELETHLMLLSKHSHHANGEMLVPIKDKERSDGISKKWLLSQFKELFK